MLLSQQGFYFYFSFKREFFCFWKTMKLLLTFFSVKKEAKKHPP